MDTPVIAIEHLKKGFGKKQVLQDINLNIAKGENLVVLGKSGSGKSVLIKCLARLVEPDSGTIQLLGESMLDLDDDELNRIRKKIGFLFQSGALYDSMTVGENLAFPLRRDKSRTSQQLAELVAAQLEDVGLGASIDKMPSELSGGMRKRIGLARTLIMKPEIMFYDEPTTGLDPITGKEISRLIVEIQKKYNTTSIIITHDVTCAEMTADRIIVLNEGVIAADGTFKELQQSKDEMVRSFFE